MVGVSHILTDAMAISGVPFSPYSDIERAKQEGKYQGRKADSERHRKVYYYRHEKGLSLSEVAEATGYSRSQVCRILAKRAEE